MERHGGRAGTFAGPGEALLYAATVLLAAAPLDVFAVTNTNAALLRAACWGIVYAMLVVMLLARAWAVLPVLRRNAPLLAVPLLALLSVAWSSDPPRTAVAGLQVLSMVMFGTLMGLRLPRETVAALVLLVLLPVALASAAVIAGHPMGIDENGDAVGVFSHKNTLGNRAAILLLAAGALLMARRLRLAALAGVALGVGLLALSGSRTAWVAAAASVLALVAARALRLSSAGAAAAVAIGGVGACAAGAILVSGAFDPAAMFFQTLDRDPTMTGRTVLWELAVDYIRAAPILGHGFDAFWDHSRLTSGAAFVSGVMGQELPHFHNGYVEMAVQLGLVGALLLVLATLFLLLRGLRLLRQGSAIDGSFAVGLLALVAVTNMAEVALFQRHGLALLLLSALAAQAVRRLQRRAATVPPMAVREPA